MARISVRRDARSVKVLLGEAKSTVDIDGQDGKEDNDPAGKIVISDVLVEGFREYLNRTMHVKVSLNIGSLYFDKVFVFTYEFLEQVQNSTSFYHIAADRILLWLEDVVKENNGYLPTTAASRMLRTLYNLTHFINAR